MKLPLSLIKAFIPLDQDTNRIAEVLTLLGIEVDAILDGNDPVFELSLTPNLGHCMSALGIARELAAALCLPLARPAVTFSENSHSNPIQAQVETPDLCSRYMGRTIEGVKVGPSPLWLQQALSGCGLQSINNVVDAGNYIMMKVGQPFHLFDLDRIEGKNVHVKKAVHPEKFLCLDGTEKAIPKGALAIYDDVKPIAIAGIMGGASTAIQPTTTTLFIEAASFDPIVIRNTAKKMGLRSESSQRFEKGIDPLGIGQALDELSSLLIQIAGGQINRGTIDIKAKDFAPKRINCRTTRVNRILGTKLSFSEVEAIFHRLGFKTEGEQITVPLYRTDILEEIDLIEEVARIYGYNNIDKTAPLFRASPLPHDPIFLFERDLRLRLVSLGLQEFLSCDLISPRLSEVARKITPKGISFLQTLHSKSDDYSILRTSLLPGMLCVTEKNLAQKNQTLSSFELGRIHFLQNEKLVEIPTCAILLTGKAQPANWSRKAEEVDFFSLKGCLENLLGELRVACSFLPSKHMVFHPGQQADICSEGIVLGSLGGVHPSLLEPFGIEQKVYYAELNLEALLKSRKPAAKMTALPSFPASERDLTLSLEPDVLISTVFETIYAEKVPLLERVELIDLYQPQHATKKNATFRFLYRDRSKTISFEEVESAHNKILKLLAK